ncbi:hypothetical protein [Nocardioides sp. W7]|uniref:hypothetical protein n=1 Tax=Nocardioides sp. W7 TaxID=2931390 RepID=UPI001FD2F62E|nr:hypothetical protein [Nocardioides sp. W7]
METEREATTAAPAFLRFADAALDRALDGDGTRLEQARAELADPGDEVDAFGALCANVGAHGVVRELLALLLACETDLSRTARLATLTGSGRPGRLTLGAAARLLGGVGPTVVATGPASPLRRAAVVELVETGPWSTTEIVLAPSVVWAFGGDPSPDPDLPLGAWMMAALPGSVTYDDRLVLVSGPTPYAGAPSRPAAARRRRTSSRRPRTATRAGRPSSARRPSPVPASWSSSGTTCPRPAAAGSTGPPTCPGCSPAATRSRWRSCPRASASSCGPATRWSPRRSGARSSGTTPRAPTG